MAFIYVDEEIPRVNNVHKIIKAGECNRAGVWSSHLKNTSINWKDLTLCKLDKNIRVYWTLDNMSLE